MNSILGALVLLASAQIEVTVAPDKDLPIAYGGEPIILGLRSDDDTSVEGYLTLDGPSQYAVPVGPMTLWAGEARWLVFEDQAQLYGVYTGTLVLNGEESWAGTIARVPTPHPRWPGPISIALPITGPPIPAPLHHLPLSDVSLPWTRSRGVDSYSALSNAGYVVAITDADADAVLGAMEGSEGGLSGDWFVSGSVLTEMGARLDRTLPKLGLAIRHPDELKRALLTAKNYRPPALALATSHDGELTIERLLEEAAQLGHEGIEIRASSSAEIPLANSVVVALAEGARHVSVPLESLLDGKTPTNNFVVASEINRRLAGARYAGPLNLGEGARGYVFHTLANDGWTVWLWARDNRPVEIPVGDAANVVLQDARSNPRTLGDYSTGRLALSLSEEVLVLSGAGGSVLAESSRQRTRMLAMDLAERGSEMVEALAPLAGLAEALSTLEDPAGIRFAFFGLLRTLPVLESAWRHLPALRDEAGPIMMHVARLGEAIALQEQEIAGPFLEPLHETLARSTEFLAEFEAARRPATARSEWLREEVARLVARAGVLRDHGRSVEGGAIAVLAEWRARALLEHLNDTPPQVESEESAEEEVPEA